MSTFTEARTALVTAFTDAKLVAFGYQPGTLIPPAVIVDYGDPWLEPSRVGTPIAARIRLVAVATVAVVDAANVRDQLEQLVESILAAIPSGFAVENVDRPNVDDTGSQGSVLEARINLTAQVRG